MTYDAAALRFRVGRGGFGHVADVDGLNEFQKQELDLLKHGHVFFVAVIVIRTEYSFMPDIEHTV